MTHPPDVVWIAFSVQSSVPEVSVGWRDEEGKPAYVTETLSLAQAAALSISCDRLCREAQAHAMLNCVGWTIYPHRPILNAETLWTS